MRERPVTMKPRVHGSTRSSLPGPSGPTAARYTVLVGILLASVLAAVLTWFPSGRVAPVFLLLAAVGIGIVARRGLSRASPEKRRVDVGHAIPLDWYTRAFQTPRLFFYLGLLTIAQLSVRLPLGGITLSDLFFLISLGLTGATLLSTRRPLAQVLPVTKVWLGVLMLSVGGLLSSFSAIHPASSLATLARLVYLTAIWFVLGSVVLVRWEHVERAVQLWTVSAAITGAGAVAQLLFGDVIPSTSFIQGRMTGFTQHVNDLGGVTSIALAPAIMLTLNRAKPQRTRLTAALCTLLIAAGLLLSGSIGGMMAAAIALLVLVTASRAIGRLVVVLSVAALLALVPFAMSTQMDVTTPAKRFAVATGAEGSERDTLAARLRTFRDGWERITENPFIGVGLGAANATLGSGYRIHNMVLSFWVEAGILGVLGMVVILLSLVGLVCQAARLANSGSEWALTVGLGASFAALIAFGMGAPVAYQRYGWVCAALIIAVRARQRTRGSESTEERSRSAMGRVAVRRELRSSRA